MKTIPYKKWTKEMFKELLGKSCCGRCAVEMGRKGFAIKVDSKGIMTGERKQQSDKILVNRGTCYGRDYLVKLVAE